MKAVKELVVIWTMVMLSLSAAAETLTYVGVPYTDGTYYMSDPKNWKTASGETRLPVEGEDLIVDGWRTHWIAATCEAYVRSITFTEWFYCYGFNWTGFSVKSGGAGVVFDARHDYFTAFPSSNVGLYLDGEVLVNTKIDTPFKMISGRDAVHSGRILKTGGFYLSATKVGANWTGATIREGTIVLSDMNGQTGLDFVFDGTDDSAYLKLAADINLVNGALRSSEDLPTANHGVTDDGTGKTLTLSGNLPDAATKFGGGLHGAASFAFAPADASKSFTFVRAQSTSTGAISVNNGTVVLADGASLPALTGLAVNGNSSKLVVDASADQNLSAAALTLSNGGRFEVRNGFVRIAAATVEGTPVSSGVYGTKAGDNCTKADWIEGSGYVLVGVSEGEAVLATWNGTGAVSSAANWEGGQPSLHTGSAQVTVAGGASLVADTDIWLKGVTLGADAFALNAAMDKEIWLGSQGLYNPNGVNLSLAGDILSTTSQNWNMGAGQLTVAGHVKACGQLLISTEKPVVCQDGVTFDANLDMLVTANFVSEADAAVTFGGEVCASGSGSYLILSPADGSTVTCNGPCVAKNCCQILGNGTLILNDRLWVYDRLYIRNDENCSPTVEFHARGNRLNRFIGTQNTGTLKTMVEGAFSSDDNVQLSPKGSMVIDLCGHDQSVVQIGMHASGNDLGGTVTSENAAVLHLRPNEYWPGHCYSQCFDRSSPEFYGYETADKGHWEGGVTLSYEAANDLTRSIMRTSSTTGNIEVVSGTLVFLRRAKTNGETFDLKGGSSNPYERLADEDGAWPNASKIVVCGGVLKLEHGKAFGKEVAVELSRTGKLRLEAGVRQSCATLKLDGEAVESGTYGSSESSAEHKDDEHFAGPGILRVGQFGLILVVE